MKGKFFTKDEGKAFFSWLVKEWGKNMDVFLEVLTVEEIKALSAQSRRIRRKRGMVLQQILMGMMLYLGGGLRKQVFVNLYADHLQWDADEMVMWVGDEKVACVNASHLPLPPQLFTYIEFFKQRVRPHLCKDPADPPLALWLTRAGNPMSSAGFAMQLNFLIQDFNPELTTTAIDFRRMTITDLFAGAYPKPQPSHTHTHTSTTANSEFLYVKHSERIPLEEGETIEHLHHRFSDYLGVSVKIMKTVYNR
jgi:hypothetical protein